MELRDLLIERVKDKMLDEGWKDAAKVVLDGAKKVVKGVGAAVGDAAIQTINGVAGNTVLKLATTPMMKSNLMKSRHPNWFDKNGNYIGPKK